MTTGRVAQSVGLEHVGRNLLRGRARQHAHRRPVEILHRLGAGVPVHHEPLAVVERGRHEVDAELRVAPERPCDVAGQDIDLSGLQRGEAGLRRRLDELDLLAVAERGGGDGLAGVDVHTLPPTLAVERGEAGAVAVDSADDGAALLDRIEGALCGNFERRQHGSGGGGGHSEQDSSHDLDLPCVVRLVRTAGRTGFRPSVPEMTDSSSGPPKCRRWRPAWNHSGASASPGRTVR